ncbi:nuclear transport factor 2 family protein [Sphaerisporangium fuscum]|uniref:nuclear transport factor 2 family protein n=1 Tax=Sphaerisporangium fuscum TaxID=2835868 RepID=UPI001BDD1391|nr:nuclear transport factor 2 family protein [Sphaerisporangium fuscum]
MSPTQNVRARNVEAVRTYFRVQQEKDLDAWTALWAEDGSQAMPFLPEGFPKLVTGRDRLEAVYLSTFGDGPSSRTILDLRIDALDDPDRVLARWRVHAGLPGGGVFDSDFVGLFEFDGHGRIRLLTEYFDPTPFVRGGA